MSRRWCCIDNSPLSRARAGRRVLVGAVLGLALVSCAAPPPGQGTPSPSATSAPASASSTQPSRTPSNPGSSASAGPASVPVYFLADQQFGPRLAREVRKVTGDPLTAALQTMIDGPADPDYSTSWNPETVVLSAAVASGVVTVDLSDHARDAQVDAQNAGLMAQQLVYTATTADPGARVRLLVGGKVAGQLWGGVTWDDAIGRGEVSQVLSAVQLDFPAQGSRLTTDRLSFSGDYQAGTTLTWRVAHAATDEEAATGVVEATTGDGFAEFSINPQLGPGRYILELRAQRAGDLGATPLAIETREFSVHLAA